MVDVATCAVARTDVVVVAIIETHILAGLLHGALDTHLLHVWVCRDLRLDVVTLEDVC